MLEFCRIRPPCRGACPARWVLPPGGLARPEAGVNTVLVLNENYEPLNVCNARRAVVLVDRGKAEVLEHADGRVLHTASQIIQLPSVIRLVYLIRRPRPQRKLTRKELFLRDRYTCQYCGRESRDLTIDHVVPRFKGGRHSWDNLVSA